MSGIHRPDQSYDDIHCYICKGQRAFPFYFKAVADRAQTEPGDNTSVKYNQHLLLVGAIIDSVNVTPSTPISGTDSAVGLKC